MFVWLAIARFILSKGWDKGTAAQRHRSARRYSAEMAMARARREKTELIARCERK